MNKEEKAYKEIFKLLNKHKEVCNINISKLEFNSKNHLFGIDLKEKYGSVELDQMLFDLGVRTSWAKTALENLLPANKKLQLDLTNELGGNNSINKK